MPNDPSGFAELRRRLPAGAHLCLEATGGYERALVGFCHAHGLAVSVLNPAWVRAFAQAGGRLAKSDPIDATVLSAYGRAFAPAADAPPAPHTAALAELGALRSQLVDIQSQLTCAAEHLTLKVSRRVLAALERTLARAITRLEKELARTIAADRTLAARDATLQSHHGVGPLTSATLLALLPELGEASRTQIAALAGLAPYDDDSGPRRGQRHIRGGRRRVRRALYLASLSAIRQASSPLALFYRRLRAAGKPAKVALIATARKLLLALNHHLKTAWLLPPQKPA